MYTNLECKPLVAANCKRASRCARPPSPQNRGEACANAHMCEQSLIKRGFVRFPKPPSNVCRYGRSANVINKKRKTTPLLTHVLSLHSRCIDFGNREPTWQSYASCYPQQNATLMAAAIRSSSTRVSLVSERCLSSASEKMGSSQQTTRIPTQCITAAWSTQVVSIAVALASCQAPKDPRATLSLSPYQVLNVHKRSVSDKHRFFIATSSTLLPNALPVQTIKSSLLDTVRDIAKLETLSHRISSAIPSPQDNNSLGIICQKIVSVPNSCSGDDIWASFALLVYLAHEPRGREILITHNVCDMDIAVATTFLSYGRSETTRRARLFAGSTSQSQHVQNEFMRHIEDDTLLEKELIQSLSEENKESSDTDENVNTSSSGAETTFTNATSRRGVNRHGSNLVGRHNTFYPLSLELQGGDNNCVLTTKRKRSVISSTSNIHILDYWVAALNSPHVHVLLMLIASTKEAAADAAETTLYNQISTCTESQTMIGDISKESAIKSAQALRCLVRQTEIDVPQLIVWSARDKLDDSNHSRVYWGYARSEKDVENTALLACKFPPNVARLPVDCGAIAWCDACHLQRIKDDEKWSPLPASCEAYDCLYLLDHQCNDKRNHETLWNYLSPGTASSLVTGVCRSVLTFHARIPVGMDQIAFGKHANEYAQEQIKGISAVHLNSTTPLHVHSKTNLPNEMRFRTPISTPASNLALALQINETVRNLHKGRAHKRKGDPCRAFLGYETIQNERRDSESNIYDKPGCLLTIVDMSISLGCGSSSNFQHRLDATYAGAEISITVAGDSPVRITEAYTLLLDVNQPLQARALILFAASQASYMGELGNLMLAGSVNAATAAAKRILLADNNTRPMLTVWQTYRVGHRGVVPSYEGTAWSGAYGAGLEMGTSGGLGREARADTADRRHHGKFLLPQELSDEYCRRLGKTHFLPVSDKHYDAIPIQSRGIPHHAVPGVHAFLDEYLDGLESIRHNLGITSKTVDSVQVLPYSPYSERLSPDVNPFMDPTSGMAFRNPHDRVDCDGRAFLPDATLSELSILPENLVPRLRIIDASDNPDGSIHEHIDSFFNAASLLALMAQGLYHDKSNYTNERAVEYLATCIDAYHQPSSKNDGTNYQVAADAMILLCTMYPSDLRIGSGQSGWNEDLSCDENKIDTNEFQHSHVQPIIGNAYATAILKVQKACKAQIKEGKPCIGIPLRDAHIESTQLSYAREYWSGRFRRSNNPAWSAVRDLLVTILDQGGRYNLSLQEINVMKVRMESAIRNAWYVHSCDGTLPPREPNPMHGLSSPALITAEHVAPVFVDKQGPDGWINARGAVVGVKPGGFRQVLALLLGSSRPTAKDVQLWRNEGGLLLRPSSAADIGKSGFRDRSDKAYSPVGIEGDHAAYGTLDAKRRNCKRQRAAWAKNLEQVLELCVDIRPPLTEDRRLSAEVETVNYISQNCQVYRQQGIKTAEDEYALREFLLAVASSHEH